MIMNEVKSFTKEEIVNITHAKNRLESLIKDTGIFEFHTYNIAEQKLIKSPVLDGVRPAIVIAGGVIPSILNGEQLNDIDVFILNMNLDLFQDLISEKTGPWLVKYFFDEDNDPRSDDYKNDHVFATATNGEMKVQYILTDHKDRKSLLADFDYLHSTSSYHNGKLYINRETYDAIVNKTLVRQHKNKKVKAHREQKFTQRGWRTEEEAFIDSPSKTLKEILQDKLVNVRGNTPVDAWNVAAKKTNWIDDAVTKTMVDAMSKGRDTYSIHGADITLNDILDDLEDALHTK